MEWVSFLEIGKNRNYFTYKSLTNFKASEKCWSLGNLKEFVENMNLGDCQEVKAHKCKKLEGTKCFNLGGFSLYKEMLNGLSQRLLTCHYHLMDEEKACATFISIYLKDAPNVMSFQKLLDT